MISAVSEIETTLLRAEQAHAPDGILVIDALGQIVSYNRRFVEMWAIPRKVLGARSDEAVLRFVLEKLVDPQGFLARVQYLYRHRSERSVEELALRDGRVYERHSAPVNGPDGRYVGRIWYFRDITERKRAEQVRREAEHLRLHREFVADVSHELRTPLSAIEGFTETLLAGGVYDDKNCRPFLNTILRHSRRLRGLIDSLLEVSHLESDKGRSAPTRVDLGRFAREAVDGLRPLVRRKRISVALSAQRSVVVRIDEGHIARIFGNLVDNAIKYSPAGSRVRVVIARSARWALLSVADRGIGITAEDLPHIFERFRRSRTARQHHIGGNGIGLSIVKQLIERYGGSISVDSREGRGTTFMVKLPSAGPSESRK